MSPLQSGVTVTGLCVALACMTGLVACPQAVPAVAPVAACVTSVIADALAGLTLAQIEAKDGQACIADGLDVIGLLFASTDPKVKLTVAYGQAQAKRAPVLP